MRKAKDIVTWTLSDPATSVDEALVPSKITGRNVYANGRVLGDETDPYGVTAGTPGAKLDAGKAPVAQGALHYFPRAISAVARLSEIGARKYSWKGWAAVPDGENRYGNALARHELRLENGLDAVDSDTGVLEATAVAWNALARLELILKRTGKGA